MSQSVQAHDCREHAQHEVPAISPGVFDAGGRAVRRSRPGPRRSRLTTRPSSGLRPPRSARSGPRSSQPELDSCTVWVHCACSYMRDVPNGATQQQPRAGSRGRALVKEEHCAPSLTNCGALMRFGTAGSEVTLGSGLTACGGLEQLDAVEPGLAGLRIDLVSTLAYNTKHCQLG